MKTKLAVSRSFLSVGVTAALSLSLVTCTKKTSSSKPEGVNFPQSSVKRQSIGNCWMYAAMGWLESKMMQHNPGGPVKNFSESYMTYGYFLEQLADDGKFTTAKEIKAIETGGHWHIADYLFRTYGVIGQDEFITDDEKAGVMSAKQAETEKKINAEIAKGYFKEPANRKREKVIEKLNEIFEVNFNDAVKRATPSEKLLVQKGAVPETDKNLNNTLSELDDQSWETWQGDKILKRVLRSMNSGQNVVLAWYVDFNALDDRGIFSGEVLDTKGPGHQGGHMTVLEDYVSDGFDPVTGKEFFVGEGEVTDGERNLAAEYGDIRYFIIKNSWGAEREDRGSYFRDGGKGYHRLEKSYFNRSIAMTDEKNNPTGDKTNVLMSFILPSKL